MRIVSRRDMPINHLVFKTGRDSREPFWDFNIETDFALVFLTELSGSAICLYASPGSGAALMQLSFNMVWMVQIYSSCCGNEKIDMKREATSKTRKRSRKIT